MNFRSTSRSDKSTQAWKIPPHEYARQRGFHFSVPKTPDSTYVHMNDGVRLAVDTFRPQAEPNTPEQPKPTILVFTPYRRRFALKNDVEPGTVEASPNTSRYRDLFVPAGYNVVVVDVRGTGASFGHREGFRSPQERADYAEIIDWVISQPWSDGTVGITGISYLGAASDFAASTGHQAVKAIAPLFAVWDTYENNYFPGGIQLNDLIDSYSQLMIGLDQNDQDAIQPFAAYAHPAFAGPAPVDDDTDGILRDAALEDHKANYRHSDMMREFVIREKPLVYDPKYSSASFSPYSYSAGIRKDVAIYSVSGWMDGAGYANGAISRFLTLSENPRHLLLGPWDHGARSHVSPWSVDGMPDDSWWYELVRFFDEYLLGINTGIRDEEPVHYYTMHAEKWTSAEEWPPASASVEFQLTAAGSLVTLNGTLNGCTASETSERDGVSAAMACRGLAVDFGIGTGTNTRYERIAGKSPGPYYSDWQGRTNQHLCFDSPILENALTLNGHATVNLLLDSDQPDGNVFVYLTEIEADGTERYVTEGLLRLLHRAEAHNPQEITSSWVYRSFTEQDSSPFVPGTRELIRIPLLPTSWQFTAGSRIRLSVAGADKDHATQNPHGRPPRYSISVSGDSTLILPAR